MAHLSGHDGAGDAFALKGLDHLREFSQRHPVHAYALIVLRAPVDLFRSLFLNGRNYDLLPLRPRRIEHEQGKCTVAGDEA